MGPRTAAALVALIATQALPAAAQGITLSVDAGLAGVGRAGRWMPIHVDVTNQAADVSGELEVQWGDAVVQRRVNLTAPSRQAFEFYVRTGDARGVVQVSLQTDGKTVVSTDSPVRVAGNDSPFVVCLDTPAELLGGECSAVIRADGFPGSWRGLDSADDVRIRDVSNLSAEQRAALTIWRAVRRAEASDPHLRSPGVLADPAPPTASINSLVTLYASGFIVPVSLVSRKRAAAVTCGLCAFVAIASVTSLIHGRSASILVRHASVINEYDDAPFALVSTRAYVEFPTEGNFAVNTVQADGALQPGLPYGQPQPQSIDQAGRPVLRGRFGRGSSKPFTLELALPESTFRSTRDGDRIRITNVSSRRLYDCDVPAPFSPMPTVIAPGTFVEAREPIGEGSVSISCRMDQLPVEFRDPAHRVITDGATIVVHHVAGSTDSHGTR